MFKRALLFIFLGGLFGAAWGQDFGLDVGCCSQPLTQGATINAEFGGGVQDYYNSTTGVITELEFAINVSPSFSLESFQCKSFNFFQTCTPTLTGGVLFLDFSGITQTDTDSGFGSTDPETQQTEGKGVFEGLPTLLSAACLATPDIPSCTINDRGHFVVSFNNFSDENYTTDNNGIGGWTGIATSASIDKINGVRVPEPASVLFFGSALLLVGGFARRRRV